MDPQLLPGFEESAAPIDPANPDEENLRKMPRGRRPKPVPAPKKVERQEALKNRIVGLAEELGGAGFADLLTEL